MLQNAYFLAKIGADTAENEQHFAEILPKTGNYPYGSGRGRRPEAERGPALAADAPAGGDPSLGRYEGIHVFFKY